MRLVVDETHGPAGGPAAAGPVLRRYRSRAGDEAIGAGAVARPAYRELLAGGHGPAAARKSPGASSARDAWLADRRA